MGFEEERKKTWVQEKEGVVDVGKELVGFDLAGEAMTEVTGGACVANVGHQ